MPNRYNYQYITFDQLMASVEDEMSSFVDQGHFESDKFIDVVESCSSFLSVKINPTRTVSLKVENYGVNLPPDFKLWERGVLCNSYTETEYESQETTKTTVTTDTTTTSGGCKTCSDTEEVVSTVVTTDTQTTYDIHEQMILLLVKPHYSCDTCDKDPFHNVTEVSIERSEDGLRLSTAFQEGTILVTYTSDLTSPSNILVYNHPLVRDYYKYAIKERLLEELWLNNGTENVYRRYQLMAQKHNQSKIIAKRFVNTPDFEDFINLYKSKRRKMYNKYWKPLQP